MQERGYAKLRLARLHDTCGSSLLEVTLLRKMYVHGLNSSQNYEAAASNTTNHKGPVITSTRRVCENPRGSCDRLTWLCNTPPNMSDMTVGTFPVLSSNRFSAVMGSLHHHHETRFQNRYCSEGAARFRAYLVLNNASKHGTNGSRLPFGPVLKRSQPVRGVTANEPMPMSHLTSSCKLDTVKSASLGSAPFRNSPS